jgi:hypothetical protein
MRISRAEFSRAVPVLEEITSPELVLVSPAEEAAQAREALANYELEYARWIAHVGTALEAEVSEPEPESTESRSTMAAFAFTALAALACAAPLVLLIVFR